MSESVKTTGRVADRLGAAFYLTVAAIALAGQAAAAVHWLHWPVLFALPAVGALELGGIALAARADFRRRLGENALAARGLSAAVAVFAVVFNWVGHTDHLSGGFFAGMSGLGYCVWLINAGDRRRDQLRAENKLPPTPPVYGITQWVRQPWLTRRARTLAVTDATLGLYGSLSAARDALRAERRQAAISKALRRKLTTALDPVAAEIAVQTYDLDRIAAELAAGADYAGLTALLAADLTPARLTTSARAATAPRATTGQPTDGAPDTKAAAKPARAPRRAGKTDTGTAARALRERHPEMSPLDIAKRLKVSDRTVRRHLNGAASPSDLIPLAA